MFDAKAWLVDHVEHAAALKPATWETVCGVTLLWNLFEERLCTTQGDIPAFERLTELFGGDRLSDEMKSAYAYWLNRYVEHGATNYLFDELFARSNGKAHVAATFLDSNSTDNGRFLALLIVTYRLRNNLFHGGKRIETLNDQCENLETASRLLASVLEHFGVS